MARGKEEERPEESVCSLLELFWEEPTLKVLFKEVEVTSSKLKLSKYPSIISQ